MSQNLEPRERPEPVPPEATEPVGDTHHKAPATVAPEADASNAPVPPIRSDSQSVAPAAPMPGASSITIATDADAERQMHALSRRSFLWGGAALAVGLTGWRWLITRRTDNGIPWPFRRVLDANGELARDYYSNARLSPTFPAAAARGELRVNGDLGLSEDFDPAQWKLSVEGLANADEPLSLTLEQIKALPPVEMITELKCIEGWSMVVKWTGARLADFMAKYPPATKSGAPPDVLHKPHDLVRYVSLATPDGGYYVGLDMESALHPQTLLCYAMNDKPLTADHGAPLRLAIPVKYGIKNIKRIGTIKFTDQRPTDYWAEQGYDWYAGH